MIGSLYILRPFIPGLIWATTIVVATWPVMLAVQREGRDRFIERQNDHDPQDNEHDGGGGPSAIADTALHREHDRPG
ncbi:hypothetical protein ACRXB1_32305, partial [Caballeronia sp. M23-90]